ncbi:MAG: type III-A CRISPR-associated protein Cas10/Csm1 [Candidatus Binataceae bacterium]
MGGSPILTREFAAECALGALLRGAAEFARRAMPDASSALACERLAERAEWLNSNSAADALKAAAGSYNPRTPIEHLLDIAWRAASGPPRNGGRRTSRTISPMGAIFRWKPAGAAAPELPMAPLQTGPSIFPVTGGASDDGAVRKLFEDFSAALSALRSADSPALIQSLIAALETFAWCVPADDYGSVSIFELSRSAAAIAAALAAAAPPDATPERLRTSELMLVVGDLGGIQRFLYTTVPSKAARMLRGRSLGLQLIADAIAARILADLGLPATNLLYSGGGKLWLLISAASREALAEKSEQIDLELNRAFASRLSFGIGCAPASLDQLTNNAPSIWERATRDLARNRRRRFSYAMEPNYAAIFEPFGDPARVCQICGAPDRNLERLSPDNDDRERLACVHCRDFVKLGGYATRAKLIIRATTAAAPPIAPLCSYRAPGGGEIIYWRLQMLTGNAMKLTSL